jgi:hypothetical protein
LSHAAWLEGDDLAFLQALCRWLLPGADPDDPEALGTAFFLWERMFEGARVAVQNAIAGALGGR